MSITSPRRGLAWAAMAASLFAVALAAAQEPDHCSPSPWSLERLTHMSWPELEQLYRQSEPGTIPTGYARGKAIYCPDARFAGARSGVTNALWHGKHFCPEDGTLINQWCGVRAIRAKVDYGPSWLDGKQSIVMDYRGMSRVWNDVRDEVREVAPGLYLGRMYRRRAPCPEFQFFFALEACSTAQP